MCPQFNLDPKMPTSLQNTKEMWQKVNQSGHGGPRVNEKVYTEILPLTYLIFAHCANTYDHVTTPLSPTQSLERGSGKLEALKII